MLVEVNFQKIVPHLTWILSILLKYNSTLAQGDRRLNLPLHHKSKKKRTISPKIVLNSTDITNQTAANCSSGRLLLRTPSTAIA